MPAKIEFPSEKRVRRELLAWFADAKRDLPWRRTRDPYAILVSEVMLQQTRVETAIEYFKKFLAKFPNVRALAGADINDVLAVWAGLGYYRRARMLHSAAKEIVTSHSARVPNDFEKLKSLPGIGAYTAGAIASIAYQIRVPAVDGNVIRVLSRILALRDDPYAKNGRAVIDDLATKLINDCDQPGAWTESLMELGATVCVPTNPNCSICPISKDCGAFIKNLTLQIPPPKKRRAQESVRHAAAVVERGGEYLLFRRAPEQINGGLFEFATVELDSASMNAATALASLVREKADISVIVSEPVATIRHSITYRRIDVEAYSMRVQRGTVSGGDWLSAAAARLKGVTAATRKILDAIETSNSKPIEKRPVEDTNQTSRGGIRRIPAKNK
ncbi:MAG: A/G-specific adenine glycosylase [Planctomycetota bacterium]